MAEVWLQGGPFDGVRLPYAVETAVLRAAPPALCVRAGGVSAAVHYAHHVEGYYWYGWTCRLEQPENHVEAPWLVPTGAGRWLRIRLLTEGGW